MAMVLFLNRETFQPEDVKVMDEHIHDSSIVTFVDFIPGVIERTASAAMSQGEVKYHSFRSLIETANRWLQKNAKWQLFHCETIMLLYKYNDIRNYYELRPTDTCFYISGSEKTNLLRGLRLWIRVRKRKIKKYPTESQELNYADIIPQIDDKGDFDNLDKLIKKANILVRKEEIQGRIICIETVSYEAGTDWKIDTEVTLSAFSTKKLFILRIFYEEGKSLNQEIGIIDFTPKHLSGGGFFKRPQFESFNEVMARASIWLTHNPEIHFLNAQSIDIKLSIKSLTTVDSKIMYYTDYGSYLRIFRVAYYKSLEKEKEIDEINTNSRSILHLSSELFLPLRKKDTLCHMRERFEDWLFQMCEDCYKLDSDCNQNVKDKLRVLSAETIVMFCKSDDEQLEESIVDTFHYNRFGAKNGFLFMIFRLYFDVGNNSVSTINGNLIKLNHEEPINGTANEEKDTSNSRTCILI